MTGPDLTRSALVRPADPVRAADPAEVDPAQVDPDAAVPGAVVPDRADPGAGAAVPPAAADPAGYLRSGLLLLAGLGTVGTAVELASLRHWESTVQLVPWVALAVTVVAIGLLALAPGPQTVRAVRVVAAALFLVAAFGTYEHVLANYHVAPLDFRYAARWPAMSAPARWWAAASGAVGPSPALAPAVLAQSALCLWLACVRHPKSA